jgi:hypothetical protein
VADVTAWGAASFSNLSVVPVDAGAACLNTVQLQGTAVVTLHKNTLPEDSLGACCALFLCISTSTWLQP